jgi:hypothetical protein
MSGRFPRRTLPPLWFELAVLAAIAAIAHAAGAHTIEHSPIALAWVGWLIVAAQVAWTGIQAAATATVAFLSWAVGVLFSFAATLWNAVRDLGSVALSGMRHSWGFLRDTYEHVLRPAWQRFWRYVDIARDTLDRTLRPVFRWLRRVREWVNTYYERYVRPVLDTIDVARRALRMLAELGVDWARGLDARLATLQERIDAPFRRVLSEINRVIGVVNQIATAGGLLQRLALVRSLERDIDALADIWNARFHRRPTDAELARARERSESRTAREHAAELTQAISTHDNALGRRIDEHAADVRLMLQRRAA